jgi:hypothetical protein
MWIWMLLAASLPEIDATERWIGDDTIAIGFNADGSLVNDDIPLGILWAADSDDGVPMGGDMLRVGREWEVWSWSYYAGDSAETMVNYAPYGDSDLLFEWFERVDTGALVGLRARGSTEHLSVRVSALTRAREDAAIIDIEYTALVDITGLMVARNVDPDPDFWATGAYSTINESGEGYAVGTGAFDDRALALVGARADESLGIGGVCDWCTTPTELIATAGASGEGDDQIGVAVNLGDLTTGETVSVRFVYAVAPGTDAALDLAWNALVSSDLDGDGLSADEGDCDDWDATVYAGAVEWVDEIDNDCDGDIDEDTVASDDDGDGYSEADGDCDDDDPAVYPGADPVEGVTNADCDGEADTGGAEDSDTGNSGAMDTADTEDDTGEADEMDDTATPEAADEATEDPIASGDSGSQAAMNEDAEKDTGCGCASASASGGYANGWMALLFFGWRRSTSTRERT